MGRYIIKIDDLYFEWATVVDSPVTYGMTKDEMTEHIRYRYGQSGIEELPRRLDRVEKQGTSGLGTLDELLEFNRAGDNEECLTKDEIYKKYSSGGLG